MADHLLLIVRTALRRYAVRRDDVLEIKLVDDVADFPTDDPAGRSSLGVELGPLLDPSDCSVLTRRRALIVPLRRRLIALLADHVELFEENVRIDPLPILLREQLRQPWAIGALLLDTDLVVQIDLRAIARTALASRLPERS